MSKINAISEFSKYCFCRIDIYLNKSYKPKVMSLNVLNPFGTL